MKTLQQHLNEALRDDQKVPMPGALWDQEFIEWAAKFNPKDIKNLDPEKDWEEFDKISTDIDWVMNNEKVMTNFCDLCKKIVKSKISMSQVNLGNWYGFESDEDPEYTLDQIGAKPGDTIYYHLTDGDNGEFFVAVASKPADKKLLQDLYDMTTDSAGWMPELTTAPELYEDEDEDDD